MAARRFTACCSLRPDLHGAGRIVGINTAIAGGAHGICFAIGIDIAANVAGTLMREGRVRRSRLRFADSPAQRAGLEKGDVRSATLRCACCEGARSSS